MAAIPDRPPGAEIEDRSRLRLTELDRDWALRRLELFRSLDGSVRQAMATVLEATTRVLQGADELRGEIEQQASDQVADLRAEREAILHEIEAHRRQRDALNGEIAELRRRAEEEAGQARRAAEEEAARLHEQAEAETAGRRREAEQQIASLRRQADEEIAAVRQQADAEIASMREQAEAERDRVLGEAQARRLALLGEIRDLEAQLGNVASQLQAMVARPLPGSDRVPPDRPPEHPVAASTGPVGRKAAARLAGAAPRSEALPGPAPTASPPAPGGGANGGVSAPEATARSARATAIATTASTEARVTVRDIAAFSSALELQRSLQNSPGVRNVQALRFENGTLVLAVEHDADLDLADTIAHLPIQTELLARSAGHLELTAPPR